MEIVREGVAREACYWNTTMKSVATLMTSHGMIGAPERHAIELHSRMRVYKPSRRAIQQQPRVQTLWKPKSTVPTAPRHSCAASSAGTPSTACSKRQACIESCASSELNVEVIGLMAIGPGFLSTGLQCVDANYNVNW